MSNSFNYQNTSNEKSYTVYISSNDKVNGNNNNGNYQINWDSFLPRKYQYYKCIFNFATSAGNYRDWTTTSTINSIAVLNVNTGLTYSSARVNFDMLGTSCSFDTSSRGPSKTLGYVYRDPQSSGSSGNSLQSFYMQSPPKTIARPTQDYVNISLYNTCNYFSNNTLLTDTNSNSTTSTFSGTISGVQSTMTGFISATPSTFIGSISGTSTFTGTVSAFTLTVVTGATNVIIGQIIQGTGLIVGTYVNGSTSANSFSLSTSNTISTTTTFTTQTAQTFTGIICGALHSTCTATIALTQMTITAFTTGTIANIVVGDYVNGAGTGLINNGVTVVSILGNVLTLSASLTIASESINIYASTGNILQTTGGTAGNMVIGQNFSSGGGGLPMGVYATGGSSGVFTLNSNLSILTATTFYTTSIVGGTGIIISSGTPVASNNIAGVGIGSCTISGSTGAWVASSSQYVGPGTTINQWGGAGTTMTITNGSNNVVLSNNISGASITAGTTISSLIGTNYFGKSYVISNSLNLASMTITTYNSTGTSLIITASPANVIVGQGITGSNIPSGSLIVSGSGNNYIINNPCSVLTAITITTTPYGAPTADCTSWNMILEMIPIIDDEK